MTHLSMNTQYECETLLIHSSGVVFNESKRGLPDTVCVELSGCRICKYLKDLSPCLKVFEVLISRLILWRRGRWHYQLVLLVLSLLCLVSQWKADSMHRRFSIYRHNRTFPVRALVGRLPASVVSIDIFFWAARVLWTIVARHAPPRLARLVKIGNAATFRLAGACIASTLSWI